MKIKSERSLYKISISRLSFHFLSPLKNLPANSANFAKKASSSVWFESTIVRIAPNIMRQRHLAEFFPNIVNQTK